MALFGNKTEGGLMDVIRCDEQEYLVWKWRPSGTANSTKKENAIRYGSSLRVKDGELAVFMYQQNNGTIQDYILGSFDETIKRQISLSSQVLLVLLLVEVRHFKQKFISSI